MWYQSFTVGALDELQLEAMLAMAGVSEPTWVGARRKWVCGTVTHAAAKPNPSIERQLKARRARFKLPLMSNVGVTSTAPLHRQFHKAMVTCHLKYIVDSTKLAEFEKYCRMWLPLIKRFGGVHHGYLLPSEGASNIALGSFSFESLAAYEQYRIKSLEDSECQAAFKFAKESKCFCSYERTFFRPIFPE